MILAVLALAVLSQDSQGECVSAYGQTRCPRTPWGKCVAAYGEIFCGDPSPHIFRFLESPPPITCVTGSGTGACGYDCKNAYGQVKCAKTPWGRCEASYGALTCSDPATPPRTEGRMDCVSAYGKQACGFDCKAAYGEVACAKTEWGRCIAAYGQVTCGDPPRWALRHRDLPQVSCLSAYGKAVCGYGCQAGYGQVACSSNPWGRCLAAYGRVTCNQ